MRAHDTILLRAVSVRDERSGSEFMWPHVYLGTVVAQALTRTLSNGERATEKSFLVTAPGSTDQ